MNRVDLPFKLQFVDEDKRTALECFNCKSTALIPYQSNCGTLSCTDCNFKKSCEHDCFGCNDIRIQRTIKRLAIRCNFHALDCKWIGYFPSYSDHLNNECKFAVYTCKQCTEDVTWKDRNKHNAKCHLRNKKTNVECSLGCGYVCSERLMEIHLQNECPRSRLKCVLGDDCKHKHLKHQFDDHHRDCVSVNIESILTILSNTHKETCTIPFNCPLKKMQFTVNFFHNFQKQYWLAIHFSNLKNRHFFSVDISRFVFDSNSWWSKKAKDEFWSKTTVTMAIVNQTTGSKSTTMSAESNLYVKPLSFFPSNETNLLFSESKFIRMENIERNSETNPSFHEDGMIRFVITFSCRSMIPCFGK